MFCNIYYKYFRPLKILGLFWDFLRPLKILGLFWDFLRSLKIPSKSFTPLKIRSKWLPERKKWPTSHPRILRASKSSHPKHSRRVGVNPLFSMMFTFFRVFHRTCAHIVSLEVIRWYWTTYMQARYTMTSPLSKYLDIASQLSPFHSKHMLHEPENSKSRIILPSWS